MQKKIEDLRIIFMGTPEFAVASLQKLVDAGCNIVGVITAPDKQAGRGMQLQQSAVKKYATEKGLLVLQPEKLKNEAFIDQLKSLAADIQVVVAFRMLPEVVWAMPALGTINVHGSLLPQYRGAAPINWAIINGDKTTGVTTFKLEHAIDTGNILLKDEIRIEETDNAGSIHDKLMQVGANLLLQTLQGIANNSILATAQQNKAVADLKHAPKIFTETCIINFNKSVAEVNNLIRGLSPFPTAFTNFEEKKLKIFTADVIFENVNESAGTYLTDKKSYLHFACIDGYIAVKELQLEGKKKMDIESFLRGYRFL